MVRFVDALNQDFIMLQRISNLEQLVSHQSEQLKVQEEKLNKIWALLTEQSEVEKFYAKSISNPPTMSSSSPDLKNIDSVVSSDDFEAAKSVVGRSSVKKKRAANTSKTSNPQQNPETDKIKRSKTSASSPLVIAPSVESLPPATLVFKQYTFSYIILRMLILFSECGYNRTFSDFKSCIGENKRGEIIRVK